jgi:putative effector of murein hydrolase
MAEFLQISLLPLTLTVGAYQLGLFIQKKLRSPLCNPILVAVVLVLLFMAVTGMELETYQAGATFLSWLITPATVCLAISMYEQFQVLRKNTPVILAGVAAGAVACLVMVLVLSLVFGFDRELTVSLLPKSVTTAIGVPLSTLSGGVASITTAAIILTIQSNIVLSLGMVGALSIVRFRTAIKDPMDLMFLFWSISVGIICGARFYGIAVILSLVLTVGILVLERIPFAKASMILVVNASDPTCEDEIASAITPFCKHAKVKSRNLTKQSLDLTYELRTDQESELIQAVTALDNVDAASLLSHDGEVTF